MIGIISYLPNSDIRNVRLRYLSRLINSLRLFLPSETIRIVAQNYCEKDYKELKDNNLLFHSHSEGIGAANARNEILNLFYKSNDKVLILSDDDIKIYPYYNIGELIKRYYWGNEIKADLICELDPVMRPFKETNIKNNVESFPLFS